jgi:hypothetical protein
MNRCVCKTLHIVEKVRKYNPYNVRVHPCKVRVLCVESLCGSKTLHIVEKVRKYNPYHVRVHPCKVRVLCVESLTYDSWSGKGDDLTKL